MRQQRTPMLVQRLLTYLTVVAIMFVALFLVVRQARTTTIESYLKERQYALQSSVDSLERQIENFRSIPTALRNSDYHRQARLLRPGEEAPKHYYIFHRVREMFSQHCNHLINASNNFIYFSKSGGVVWRDQYSFNADEHLSSIYMDDEQHTPLLDVLGSKSEIQELFPVLYMNNGVQERQLLYLYHTQPDSGIYGMLMSKNDLDAFFHFSELPAGSYLKLEHITSSQTLYSSGECTAISSYTLNAPLSILGLSASITIPAAYFDQLTRPVTYLLSTYIIVTLAASLGISLWLAQRSVKPVQQMLQTFEDASPAGACRNEIYQLDRRIRQTHQYNQQLKQQIASSSAELRQSMLARLMVQETFVNIDKRLANDYLPSFESGGYLLCMELGSSTALDEATSYQCRQVLDRMLPADCLLIPMRYNQYVALLHDRENLLQELPEMIERMDQELPLRLSAGLSERFTDLSALHECYTRTLYTLRYNPTPPLSIFEPLPDDNELRFNELATFRNALLTGDEKAAEQCLTHFEQLSYQHRWLLKSVRFILDSVCKETRLDIVLCEADNESLKAYTKIVVGALLEKQRHTAVNALCDNVLSYLESSYADSSLSADSLAEQFHVSRSHLYRIFRESFDMTPSDKLEQIRMQHAQQLLNETKLNVTEIAVACGYNSSNTFYKAYRKCFGCSPNALRGANAASKPQG